MIWSDNHDILLCREILASDPFANTRKGTIQRGKLWKIIAHNLSGISEPPFKADLDQRSVRDRYTKLSNKLRAKLKYEKKASGIATDMTEIETALEEIIEKEDAAEDAEREDKENKQKNIVNQVELAQDIRAKAMEKLADTKRRNGEEKGTPGKKKRRTGNETLHYLKEKNEAQQSLMREEMALKVKQQEAEANRHQ